MAAITQHIGTVRTLADAPSPLTDTQEVFDQKGWAYTQSQKDVNADIQDRIVELNTFADQANVLANYVNTAKDTVVAASQTVVQTANAELWVSGHSYLKGENAVSLIDFQTYRAKVNTSGITDPKNSAEWVLLSPKQQKFVFTESTVFTKPTWAKTLCVILISGGGGGGGNKSQNAGGGAGGEGKVYFLGAEDIPDSIQIIIGAGGQGGNATYGVDGGTTSFLQYKAYGGRGGDMYGNYVSSLRFQPAPASTTKDALIYLEGSGAKGLTYGVAGSIGGGGGAGGSYNGTYAYLGGTSDYAGQGGNGGTKTTLATNGTFPGGGGGGSGLDGVGGNGANGIAIIFCW